MNTNDGKQSNPAPNIPKIASIKNAETIYYQNNELGNREIEKLFSCCTGTAQKLKKFAQEYTRDESTEPAFGRGT